MVMVNNQIRGHRVFMGQEGSFWQISYGIGLAENEIIDPVFAKTSLKRSFSMTEYERFGLVFTKTRVYKFGL
jgi:hypothetical protein